jgi:hypothetical protein
MAHCIFCEGNYLMLRLTKIIVVEDKLFRSFLSQFFYYSYGNLSSGRSGRWASQIGNVSQYVTECDQFCHRPKLSFVWTTCMVGDLGVFLFS